LDLAVSDPKASYTAYGRVPKTALTDRRLSSRSVHLLAWIDDQAGFNDSFSRGEIADVLGCSARTAQRCVTELIDAGYLKIASRIDVTGQRPNAFSLVDQTWTPVTRGVDTGVQGGWTPVSLPLDMGGQPYKETRHTTRQKKDKNKAIDQPELPMLRGVPADPMVRFEEFWSTYGHKKSRPVAEREWVKAVKLAEPEKIIKAAARYAAATPDKQFRKHPSTWLHQHCWDDELPDRVRPVSQQREVSGGWGF
jgi:hypothetical protein